MYSRLISLAIVCALFVIGCDSKPYGLAPVSGIVTLDGKPIEGARVSFQPQGTTTNPGPGSIGVCDASGRYELKTIRNEPGAVPGSHTVRIVSPRRGTGDGSVDTDPVNMPKDPIPPRYNSQTELTFTVPEEGTDSADFELISK